jgi:hypothetical protein
VNKKKADLFQNFLKIIGALNKFKVQYIVIGGVALISHGLPRLTRDLDLILNMTAENIKNLRHTLKSLYDDPAIEEITIEELGKYAVLRYGTPDDFYIDLMACIGEAADYHTLQAETKEIEGIRLNLATPESLLKLKQNTLRPEDKRDALFLMKLIEAQGKNNAR